MADIMIPRRSHEIMEALTAEDFETASIRSAAPSYYAGAALIWAQCVVIGVFRSSAGHANNVPRAWPFLAGTPAACPLARLRVCPSCLMLLHAAPCSMPPWCILPVRPGLRIGLPLTALITRSPISLASEAPTLHYTVPSSGYSSLLPPYTAPPVGSAERVVAPPRHRAGAANATVAARRAGSAASGTGAGAVFNVPPRMDNVRRDENIPDLSRFRVPSWSTISTSPNARLYHSVALRRVAAAEHASAAAEIGGLMRRLAVLERMEQEEAAASRRMAAAAARRNAAAGGGNGNGNASGNGSGSVVGVAGNSRSGNGGGNNAIGRLSTGNGSFRPLEDPYLVGETAARRARAERMARESNAHGEEALHREDRRWDWFLGQIKNRHGSGRLRRRMDASGLAPAALRHHHARRVQ